MPPWLRLLTPSAGSLARVLTPSAGSLAPALARAFVGSETATLGSQLWAPEAVGSRPWAVGGPFGGGALGGTIFEAAKRASLSAACAARASARTVSKLLSAAGVLLVVSTAAGCATAAPLDS
eukprot:2693639-Prymnesium_polylepis.1